MHMHHDHLTTPKVPSLLPPIASAHNGDRLIYEIIVHKKIEALAKSYLDLVLRVSNFKGIGGTCSAKRWGT